MLWRVFFLSGFLSSTSFGAVSKFFELNCASLVAKSKFQISKIAPLESTTQPVLPEEAPRVGTRVTKGWKPDRLNETYAYIIDENGEGWITPEFLSPPHVNGQFLGSHRGLVAQKNNAAKVVAAGEITVKNGVIVSINNKSGTYRGKKEHLGYAAQFFKQLDVTFGPEVKAYDFAKAHKFNPNEEHGARRDYLKTYTNPAHLALRNRWETIMHDLYLLYPDPQKPGHIGSITEPFFEMFGVEHEKYDLVSVNLRLVMYNENLDYLVQQSIAHPKFVENTMEGIEEFIRIRRSQLGQRP